MDYAKEVKSRLTMPQILSHYGFTLNRSNRIPCPLHGGKDENCGVKDGYIHCFVCGETTDQLSFVQKYFGLDFQSALIKLNEDFSLGLPIGQKIDRRKQLEMGKISFERKRKQAEDQKERDRIEAECKTAFDEWKRLDDNRRKYAPKSPVDDLHPLFVEAVKNIHGAEYRLSCAEIARYEYESRDSQDS